MVCLESVLGIHRQVIGHKVVGIVIIEKYPTCIASFIVAGVMVRKSIN